MSPTQHKRRAQVEQGHYHDAKKYCAVAGMRLSRDEVSGYWLHCENTMRYIALLSDVRGWVDYLERQFAP